MEKLVIHGLSKSFGEVQALKAVELSLTEGQALAVLGPSGCGKTTLLRCIAGFEAPEAGSIAIDAQPVVDHQTWVDRKSTRLNSSHQI